MCIYLYLIIFRHSESGKITRIVYSNQQLSSRLPIELQDVKPLYSALKLFTNICYDPKNLMRFKLNEGEDRTFILAIWREVVINKIKLFLANTTLYAHENGFN